MDLYFLSVVAFLLILAFLVYRDRKNIEFHYFLLMRKTKLGLKILDKLSKPKIFWKVFGTFSIFLAIFLMFEGLSSLISYSKLIIEGIAKLPGLSLVIPSLKPEAEIGPGYLSLPFWLWLTVVISVMLPHELLHGIVCRAENIKVKSAGWLLLVVFPGAFVEPDEKMLKKSKLLSKLRVFVVGSVANFLLSLLIFQITSKFIYPYLFVGPIVLKEVNETAPAFQAGLKPGMMITKINEKEVKLSYEEFLSGSLLLEEMKDLKPGDEIVVIANNTPFKLKLASRPENESMPYMGIVASPLTRVNYNFSISVIQVLTWVWVINYAVAIFNILPIYPLDGGLIVEALIEKLNKKKAKKITIAISFITISLLLFVVVAPLFPSLQLS